MACFTVSLVVSGPGVNRSLSFSIRDESLHPWKVALADVLPPAARLIMEPIGSADLQVGILLLLPCRADLKVTSARL
jgi:hypothetical protein